MNRLLFNKLNIAKRNVFTALVQTNLFKQTKSSSQLLFKLDKILIRNLSNSNNKINETTIEKNELEKPQWERSDRFVI